jgi:hypothetical protein
MIGGGSLLQEDVGGHVVVTICKKTPAKVTKAITAAKHHMVLAVTDFAMLFGGAGESCFLSKKVAEWYKRLKDR